MSAPRYVRNPDVVSTELGDEAVLLHLHTQRYYTVNETGLAIWAQLEAPRDLDEVVAALVRDYEVEEAEARPFAEAFVEELAADGLVQRQNG